jgi:TolB-like protein/DNA-binding winged helix-turn-helix (wHTH) protein/tetratricopeptide (TPR) repeat protein
MAASNRSTFEFGEFRIDPVRRVLCGADGKPIFLKAKAFATLLYLVEHAGELCAKRELMAAVWPGLVIEENNLNQCVSALRRALGEQPGEHRFIVTEPGRGYRFVAAVSSAPAAGDVQGLAANAEPLPDERGARATRPFWRRLVPVAAAFVTCAVAVGWAAWAVLAPSTRPDVTLAVLPFEDLSPDKDQGYFADGITVELSSTLSSVKGLRVTGSTSSSRYRSKSEDARTIGRDLHVANILRGSVLKQRDDLRVAAQLIEARTGTVSWASIYRRKLTDVFAVQDEITRDVTNALQVTLGVGVIAELPGMTRNVTAFDEYFRATALRGPTAETLWPAIDHYRRAVDLDPRFAKAWLKLASAYHSAALLIPDERDDFRRRSEEAFEHARNAAPESPYVVFADAESAAAAGHWLDAGRLYDKYLPLVAQYGLQNDAWEGGGLFYLRVGKLGQATRAFERAKDGNPYDPVVAVDLAEAYSDAGDLSHSLAEFDRGLTLGGNEIPLRGAALFAALATRDRNEIAKRVGPDNPMLRFLDDPSAGLAEIRRQVAYEESRDRPDPSVYYLAAWAAYYSDPELALDLESKYVASHFDDVRAPFSLWEPIFRDMRRLPGFKDLVRDMGLVEYWRTYDWNDFCHPIEGGDDFECT